LSGEGADNDEPTPPPAVRAAGFVPEPAEPQGAK
jgi:hypothetical protein